MRNYPARGEGLPTPPTAQVRIALNCFTPMSPMHSLKFPSACPDSPRRSRQATQLQKLTIRIRAAIQQTHQLFANHRSELKAVPRQTGH